ncbi:MAG: hypothetical protein WDM88_06510 [Galbitalea sp.]
MCRRLDERPGELVHVVENDHEGGDSPKAVERDQPAPRRECGDRPEVLVL